MKQYSIVGKDLNFSLSSSSYFVTEGEEFTITLTASGDDAVEGLKVPYRIGAIDGAMPYSDWNINTNPIIVGSSVRYTASKTNGVDVYSSFANIDLTDPVINSLHDTDMQSWQAVIDACNELTGVTNWIFNNVNETVEYSVGDPLYQYLPEGSNIYYETGADACNATIQKLREQPNTIDVWNIEYSAPYCRATYSYYNPNLGYTPTNGINAWISKYNRTTPLPILNITYQQVTQKIISNASSSNQAISLLAEAYLEYVANTVFNTDIDDQYVDVSTLKYQLELNKTILSSDSEEIRRVRVADYSHGLDSSVFVLDSDLKASITFLARYDAVNETQESFVIGLLLRPEITTTVIFNNKYYEVPPIPVIPTLPKPTFSITALTPEVQEGSEVRFLITYENVRIGYKMAYNFIDTKDPVPSENFFFTNEDGATLISIPTVKIPVNESSIRLMKIWLKQFPQISSSARIIVAEVPKYNERFPPGIYEVELQPYSSYEITMIGAGGAGGGSVSNRGGNFSVDARGNNGGDTKVEFNSITCTVGGGKGGYDGHWHNGSSFHQGTPGTGGVNDVLSVGTTFIIKTNISGKPGVYQERNQQQGGASVSDNLGDIGFNGTGGKGGWGVGDEALALGGAGGSGGLIVCTLRNDTPRVRILKLTVGAKGDAFDLGAAGTWGNGGLAGEHGFAIIRSL